MPQSKVPFIGRELRNVFPARITVEQTSGRKRFKIGELSFDQIRLKLLCPASQQDVVLSPENFAQGAAIRFRPQLLPEVIAHARAYPACS